MGKNSGGGGGGGGRGRGRKNKARMNYLKEVKRQGGGEGGQQQGSGGGYKTGDYVSAYGYHSRGRGGRGRGWGGGGRGGGGGGGGRKPRSQLTGGMKGFMLTTNFRESDCVREAYNLLNEYDDKKELEAGQEVKGEGGDDKVVEMEDSSAPGADAEKPLQEKMDSTEEGGGDRKGDAEKEKDDDEEEEDIAEALQKEMKNLKSERVTKRFTCVDTGVKNVVFINTTVDDPTEIMYRIFDDVLENREAKSRHILRFMPIEATCKMDLETVKEVSKGIFQKYFKDGYKSFKIVANVRYNSSISKDEIIKTVAEAVDAVSPLNFVDLKNSTYTIVAEVLKGVVCLGVLRDFMKYKKFNIAEAAAPDKPPGDVKNPEESDNTGSVEKGKGGPESVETGLSESAGDGEKLLSESVGDSGKVIETEETEEGKKQSGNAAEEKEEIMIIAVEDKIDQENEKSQEEQSAGTSPTATTETSTVDQKHE